MSTEFRIRRGRVAAAALALLWVSGVSAQISRNTPGHEEESPGAEVTTVTASNGYELPSAIQREHDQLHRDLARLLRREGEVGKAARVVAAKLHSHFESEEAYGLPPLGALQTLATGEVSADMKPLAEKSRLLKAKLPQMLKEHREIVQALERLRAAGKAAGQEDVEEFVDALSQHARFEEEVLYPASIVIGAYIDQNLK